MKQALIQLKTTLTRQLHALVERTEQQLTTRIEHGGIADHPSEHELVLAQQLLAQIQAVQSMLDASPKKTEDEVADAPDTIRYVVSSLFLRECYDHLHPFEVERFFYISGIVHDGMTSLDRLVPCHLEEQTPTYVKADIISSTAALMMLSDRGFTLNGHCHCHPGSGAMNTHPSDIDIRHQARLERGGYRALGLIMVKSGHVRFFADALPYTVEVLGTDVEQVDEHCFHVNVATPGYEEYRHDR